MSFNNWGFLYWEETGRVGPGMGGLRLLASTEGDVIVEVTRGGVLCVRDDSAACFKRGDISIDDDGAPPPSGRVGGGTQPAKKTEHQLPSNDVVVKSVGHHHLTITLKMSLYVQFKSNGSKVIVFIVLRITINTVLLLYIRSSIY